MKRVLIIGASDGIGLETTRQTLGAGHHVRALARSAAGMALSDPNLEKVGGDGRVRSGAAAFEMGYRMFLPVRPFISQVFRQVLKLPSVFEGANPR